MIKTIKSIHHNKLMDVLVVDDGSINVEKPLEQELNKLTNDNISVRIINLERNQGITNALNCGIRYFLDDEKYKLFARIDCGDTAVKNRFRIQEDFLQKNEDIHLLGSYVSFIDSEDKVEFYVKPPVEHKKIKRKMAQRCNFIHPSVMIRKDAVKYIGAYPNQFEAAEDYAYFYKISKYFKTANINKVLTKVDASGTGISKQNRKVQNTSKLKVIKKYSPRNFRKAYGILYTYALKNTPVSLVNGVKKVVLK